MQIPLQGTSHTSKTLPDTFIAYRQLKLFK